MVTLPFLGHCVSSSASHCEDIWQGQRQPHMHVSQPLSNIAILLHIRKQKLLIIKIYNVVIAYERLKMKHRKLPLKVVITVVSPSLSIKGFLSTSLYEQKRKSGLFSRTSSQPSLNKVRTFTGLSPNE